MKTTAAVNRPRVSKAVFGTILILAGGILLLKNVGASIPDWVISWPMVLILIGIISGIKRGFRSFRTFGLILLGSPFLLDKFFIAINFSIIWPGLLIGAGLWIVLRRNFRYNCSRNYGQ